MVRQEGSFVGDRIDGAAVAPGLELLRARFVGRAYSTHRHDTYAVGVTDAGVQSFDYRGTTRFSRPGNAVVLDPDEPHDGRAGSDEAFAYRIVYVAPDRLAEAVRSVCGTAAGLPHAAEPVLRNDALRMALDEAFAEFDGGLEPLAADALLAGLARGLLDLDPAVRVRRRGLRLDRPALDRTREFLAAACTRTVTSEELECVAGHDRFALARQFRAAFGTSPYRFLAMRRADRAREAIRRGEPLAAVAHDTGFADQPHLTRSFRAAWGLSPARYRGLLASKG